MFFVCCSYCTAIYNVEPFVKFCTCKNTFALLDLKQKKPIIGGTALILQSVSKREANDLTQDKHTSKQLVLKRVPRKSRKISYIPRGEMQTFLKGKTTDDESET